MATLTNLYYILFAPDCQIVAAFADPNEAINYVLAQSDTYGFVPNADLLICNYAHTCILTILNDDYPADRDYEAHLVTDCGVHINDPRNTRL